MSSVAELEASMAESRQQLEVVMAGLEQDPGSTELAELKEQLEMLLQLTSSSLLEARRTELLTVVAHLEEGQGGSKAQDTSLDDDLSGLVGVKVSAPLTSRHHGSEWGNAVIVGVEEGEGEEYTQVGVRVAFSHPTRPALVACQYYLEGKCNRGDSCRWSHGELVKLGQLKTWSEADYSRVSVGSAVLMRGEGGVWGRATVQEELLGEYLVKSSTAESEPVTKTIEELLPLHKEDEDSDDDDDGEEEIGRDVEEEDYSFPPIELSAGANAGRLGEWEQFTRGVGSKLMFAMGWQAGTGLGKASEGKVEPVTAMLYPQGKSLDWCMERREELGEQSSVESIMKREAKEAERKSIKRAADERRRDNSAKSLFDFINVKLGGGGRDHGKSNTKNGFANNNKKTASIALKEESDKNLKIRSFETSERISRTEREIAKYRETHERLKTKDARSAASILAKIEGKEVELRALQHREGRLKQEDSSRKSKSKLSIF